MSPDVADCRLQEDCKGDHLVYHWIYTQQILKVHFRGDTSFIGWHVNLYHGLGIERCADAG